MASAIQSLIAISEAIAVPGKFQKGPASGNFFGPWIVDERWSPRKRHFTISRRGGPRPSRSTFRRTNQRSSEITNREHIPASKNYSTIGQKNLNERQARFARWENKEGNVLADEAKNSKIDGESVKQNADTIQSQTEVQRSSLPALITLTSDTGDERATFGLGKNLELNTNKLYISQRQPSPRNVISAPSGSSVTDYVPMDSHNDLRNGILCDARDNEKDVLKRALERRRQVPPLSKFGDISEHMKHYRMYHTVLGTGSVSLANQVTNCDMKPVQWSDVFPHRPLTAATPVTDVPIFRFSVADFHKETREHSDTPGSRPSKGRPPTPVVVTHSAQGREELKSEGIKKTEGKIVKDVKEVKGLTDVSTESVSQEQCENAFLKNGSEKEDTASSAVVKMSGVSRSSERSRPSGDDLGDYSDFADYKSYLKAQRTASKNKMMEPGGQPDSLASSEDSSSSGITRVVKNEDCAERKISNRRQAPVLSPVREGRKVHPDGVETYSSRPEKGDVHSKPGPDGNLNNRYPGVFCQRRVVASIAALSRNRSKKPRLFVDAQSLRESVASKTREGQRKVHHYSLSRRGERDGKPYFKYVIDPAVKDHGHSWDEGGIRCNESANLDSGNYGLERQTEECFVEDLHSSLDHGVRSKYSRLSVPSEKVGLVTAYDFKGYVKALRAEAATTNSVSQANGDLIVQPKKLQSTPREIRPSTVGDKATLILGTNKHWCPGDSRIKSRGRGGSKSEPKSLKSDLDNAEFPRNVMSASLRFKPTSPATSAFVIAAPPTPANIERRSIVLPLEEFLDVVMDGKGKTSFSQWSNCLNTSAKSALGSCSKSSTTGTSREKGLLKVVSFATPVNQFIFAKQVTRQSTQELGIEGNQRNVSAADRLFRERAARSYRLRLSDFGLPEKARKQTPINKQKVVSDSLNIYQKGDKEVTACDDEEMLFKEECTGRSAVADEDAGKACVNSNSLDFLQLVLDENEPVTQTDSLTLNEDNNVNEGNIAAHSATMFTVNIRSVSQDPQNLNLNLNRSPVFDSACTHKSGLHVKPWQSGNVSSDPFISPRTSSRLSSSPTGDERSRLRREVLRLLADRRASSAPSTPASTHWDLLSGSRSNKLNDNNIHSNSINFISNDMDISGASSDHDKYLRIQEVNAAEKESFMNILMKKSPVLDSTTKAVTLTYNTTVPERKCPGKNGVIFRQKASTSLVQNSLQNDKVRHSTPQWNETVTTENDISIKPDSTYTPSSSPVFKDTGQTSKQNEKQPKLSRTLSECTELKSQRQALQATKENQEKVPTRPKTVRFSSQVKFSDDI